MLFLEVKHLQLSVVQGLPVGTQLLLSTQPSHPCVLRQHELNHKADCASLLGEAVLCRALMTVQRRRTDGLRVIVMSATLDVHKFSAYLDDCKVAFVQVGAGSFVHIAVCCCLCAFRCFELASAEHGLPCASCTSAMCTFTTS